MNYPVARSKRGIHGDASQYTEVGHWRDLLALCRDMNMGYYKILDDGGGSCINVVRAMWWDYGIVPVIRMYIGTPGSCGPREADAIKRIADVLGFRTYFELCNEPDLPIEWEGKRATTWAQRNPRLLTRAQLSSRPTNWLQRSVDAYCDYAPKVWAAGGLPGTFALASGAMPDGSNYIKLIVDQLGKETFENIGAWVAMHNYVINHPIDYPYDAVNQEGKPLTKAEYEDVPLWAWDNRSMEQVNVQRRRDMNPGATIFSDDTCFGGYKVFLANLHALGLFNIPIGTTEGGPTQTRGDDGRYPKITQDIMLDMIPQMYREMAAVPQYAFHCHWLLYCTQNGWESDRWLWGSQDYTRVIQLFKDTPISAWGEGEQPPMPPPTPEPPTTPPVVVNDATGYGVSILPYNAPPGEKYYRIVKVHHLTPEENNGMHNLFMDVLTSDGKRAYDSVIFVDNVNGHTTNATIDKPPSEPGTNVPIGPADFLSADMGAASDRVTGIHARHPDEPPVTSWGHNGNSVDHHSFLVVWQLVTATGPVPPVEPPPVDPPPTGATSTTVDVAGQLTIITKDGAVVDYIVHVQPK